MTQATGETLTTIVFVDAEGSTGLVDRLGDAAGTRRFGVSSASCARACGRAVAHFFTGAWQDADAEIEAGLTVADETGSRNFVLFFRALLARMAIGRGRLGDAAGHIERGFGELASGSLFGVDWLFDAHAELQAASGDPAAGLATAALMWGQTAHLRYFYGYRDRCSLLLRLAIANERDDLAAEAVECLEEGARRTPVASAIGGAIQGRGLAARDAVLLGEALEHFRRTPFRPRVARCCEDLALQLAADGDRGRAVPLLEEAAELFAAIGAEGDLARTDDELRRIAGRATAPRAPRPAFGWDVAHTDGADGGRSRRARPHQPGDR